MFAATSGRASDGITYRCPSWTWWVNPTRLPGPGSTRNPRPVTTTRSPVINVTPAASGPCLRSA
ncbi:hypothetical protein DMB42_39885 [Nonomuraea sp. WAC 01424]|nr:hypothetical protein DMB42_39885 [Nonomuraea sp. WAC 01424]